MRTAARYTLALESCGCPEQMLSITEASCVVATISWCSLRGRKWLGHGDRGPVEERHLQASAGLGTGTSGLQSGGGCAHLAASQGRAMGLRGSTAVPWDGAMSRALRQPMLPWGRGVSGGEQAGNEHRQGSARSSGSLGQRLSPGSWDSDRAKLYRSCWCETPSSTRPRLQPPSVPGSSRRSCCQSCAPAAGAQ